MVRAGRRSIVVVVVAAVMAGQAPAALAHKGFSERTSRISARLEHRMKGKSWHRGCPVGFRDLRLLHVTYHGFDGRRHTGKLVANKDAVAALTHSFRVMYRKGFKIHHMWLVDRFDGKDERSMRHDNTSAFNCRKVAGTSSWSEHAYGRAIDINPVENPYVAPDGGVDPKKGRPYADRSRHVTGMIHARGAVVHAFADSGWGWGGSWSSAQDYQHFSASGH